ncbi:MAG: HEAT repeat domain-containing protein, partial [Lentisphaeraceae bacterium]|nr:HEAT repeat domain-containing protein [Lentisphaeraceae bacterium]
MNKVLLSFLVLMPLLQGGEFKQKLQQQNGLLRSRSQGFEELLLLAEKLSNQQARELFKGKLTRTEKKNFLTLWTCSGNASERLSWLLQELSTVSMKERALLNFFAGRLIGKEDILQLVKLAVENKTRLYDELIASYPSSAGFSFLLKQYKKSSVMGSSLLLNSLTMGNLAEVVYLLDEDDPVSAILARKLLNLGSSDKFSNKLLAFKLRQIKNQRVVTFSKKRIDELAQLYKSLLNDKKLLPEFFDNEKYPPALNKKVRSKIDLKNEYLLSLYRARCIAFTKQNFEEYQSVLDGIYSANLRLRLQALLRLKDAEDPSLLESFFYLLKDPSSEIRSSSLDAISILVDQKKSGVTASVGDETSPKAQIIINLLNDTSSDVKISTILLLQEFKKVKVGELILALADHKSDDVKVAVVQYIEKMETAGALQKLIEMSSHGAWNVRSRAVKAL